MLKLHGKPCKIQLHQQDVMLRRNLENDFRENIIA